MPVLREDAVDELEVHRLRRLVFHLREVLTEIDESAGVLLEAVAMGLRISGDVERAESCAEIAQFVHDAAKL